jgi:tetratricopeptide (TPR) repeat protein
MWNRAPFLSRCLWVGLVALLVGGCAAKQNQFGQQVQRINDVSIQGEKLFSQGDLKRASRNFNRALSLSRSVDYPQGAAQQLNNLGAVALEEGDFKKARDLFTQAYDLNLEQQQWAAASINQANLATVAQKEGKMDEASRHLLAAQDAARQSGSSPALARVYLQWASFYLDQNDLSSAQDFLNRARPRVTTPELKGTFYHHWGRLSLARGNTSQALAMFSLALETDRAVLDRAAMAGDLLYLGEVYQTRGNLAQAWDYYARAFDVYAGLGKKSQLSRCLKRLQEVNLQGQLGHSLERFERLAKSRAS